ncbi:unnamed protein product [marine sediment metagenome]|uniref:Uncharacterized protein n=1 Tax=marine sediment metagenome TaxID=412755 RepID=X1URX1_9ZZZZ
MFVTEITGMMSVMRSIHNMNQLKNNTILLFWSHLKLLLEYLLKSVDKHIGSKG